MKQLAVIVAVPLILFISFVSASAQMKEGLWEITTKAEMKGMPAQMPATTMKTCVSKEDMVPKPAAQGTGQECKMKEQKVVGDTVTYAMECRGKDGSTTEVNGKMTYKGNTFDGSSNTVVKTNGQTMRMSGKMTGKYLGPCTK